MAHKRILVKFLKLLVGLLLGTVALALGLAFLSPFLWNVKFLIVLSGSMEPTMQVGSLAVIREVDPARLTVDDVITYETPDADGVRVTHRVIELAELEDGTPAFQTKGDANEAEDGYLVPAENVQGRLLLSVPYVGYTREFMETPLGFMLLIMVPAGLLIMNEAVSLALSSDPRYRARKRRHRRRA